MRRRPPLSKVFTLFLALAFLGSGAGFSQNSVSGYKERQASLYRDIFDQTVYYQGTQYLHLERLYRKLFGKSRRALNVNAFDELPDSNFFTNRQGRETLSKEALKKGPAVTEGPDSGGSLEITKGKFEGITPGFFVRDSKGDRYLLKFDPLDNVELATGAEVVSSRFLHAAGYNVPQYTLVYFKKDRLSIGPEAKIIDDTGFRRKLTPERLEEFLLFIPETKGGTYRASASRILKGKILGPMPLQGRRREGSDDPIDHQDRREIRALQIFSSWINNYDVREGNTLDVLEEHNGKKEVRHYLIDFNSALGARPSGPKPPMFGFEHLFDYREIFKAFLSFGFWKKPWQRSWDEVGREVRYPSAGYMDNRYFNPGRYRTQLPYFPFKDLTRSDGFWAAKIIMKFSDDDIRAIVSTGDYSDKQAENYLADTMIQRRNLIGRYGFQQASPLDEFQLFREGDGGYELHFQDLAVRYGFEPEGTRDYLFDVIGWKGRKGIRLAQEDTSERQFRIRPEWLKDSPSLDLLIRCKRKGGQVWSPLVRVRIETQDGQTRLTGILHQD